VTRPVNLRQEYSHFLTGGLPGCLYKLTQIVVAKIEILLILGRAAVDSHDIQFQSHWENITRDGHVIAHFPLESFRELPANDAGGFYPLESEFLIVRKLNFTLDVEEAVRLNSESGKKITRVASVFVGTPEPLPDHRIAHAGN